MLVLNVSSEQLEYLLKRGFACPQIAHLADVSLSTVRRRMTENRLSVKSLYSGISDQELDSLVSGLWQIIPGLIWE